MNHKDAAVILQMLDDYEALPKSWTAPLVVAYLIELDISKSRTEVELQEAAHMRLSAAREKINGLTKPAVH